MKRILLTIFCAFIQYSWAQIYEEDIRSQKLKEKRKVTVVLPDQYDKKQKYPLFVVLNADRLLEPSVSSVRYFSNIGEMPPCIVVGIYNEEEDVTIPKETGVPFNDSANFFEFVGQEVIPHIQNKYSVNNFKGIIADDEAGNFINYYLLKEKSLFNAYLSLNPDVREHIIEPLAAQLQTFQSPIFYYLAWTDNEDLTKVAEIKSLNKAIRSKELPHSFYFSGDFPQVSPKAVAPGGIPEGLNLIFEEYRPITMREYAEKIMKIDSNIVQYLEDKYKNIKELYGIDKTPLLGDIKAVYNAIVRNGDLESLPILAEFIRKPYKDTALPDFLEGDYYDRIKLPKKAFKSYQKAYMLKDIDFITKDLIGERLERIKAGK
ncbi:MAG: alpha/beta hydrolase-fold protein [Capnocytophaga sp.]|nr:alpha/beta hydrolase-fold protein [Capnocytophaga sp.]